MIEIAKFILWSYVFIALSLPLLGLLVYSLKKILKTVKEIKKLSSIFVICFYALLCLGSSFLMTFLFLRLILDVKFNQPYQAIFFVLFFVYYLMLLSFSGVANSYIAMSPAKLIGEIVEMFKNNKGV